MPSTWSLKLAKLVHCATHFGLWKYAARGIAPTIDHAGALGSLHFGSIIDVGANRGQFALFARRRWPLAEIICFEPVRGVANALRHDLKVCNISVLECALSDETGSAPMFVTERDDSSSLLEIGRNQEVYFNTKLSHVELNVNVRRLDDLLNGAERSVPILLKLDIQGNELRALRGAEKFLTHVSSVYVECSFVELYVGQALVTDVVTFLASKGFELRGVFNQVSDGSGRPLQADFLFHKGSHSEIGGRAGPEV